MEYIGLLTDEQKRAGYFVSQDTDFIYLWHRADGTPRLISVWLYETARIKDIRDRATEEENERTRLQQKVA